MMETLTGVVYSIIGSVKAAGLWTAATMGNVVTAVWLALTSTGFWSGAAVLAVIGIVIGLSVTGVRALLPYSV